MSDSDKIKIVNKSNFDAEAKTGDVLIDFSAAWCGPCKRQLPILEKFAEETGFKVVKVDIDDSPDIAKQFSIRSVPTLVLVKDGQAVKSRSGLASMEELKKIVS